MVVRDIIKTAFTQGWEEDTAAAYHGTSLAALQEILRTGKINGSTYAVERPEIEFCVRSGDLFVFPISDRVLPGFTIRPYLTEEEALGKAKGYASDISYHHYFMKLLAPSLMTLDSFIEFLNFDGRELNFSDFSDSFHPALPRNQQHDEFVLPFYDFLISKGYNHAGIAQLHSDAKAKKGVVLGFTGAIFSVQNQPLTGNYEYDTRVQGVNTAQIVGVEPVDEESYAFLEQL